VRKFAFILGFFFCFQLAFAQIGGNHVYVFMDLANSARLSSLGSNFASVQDDDLSLAYSNPSLINPDMAGQVTLTYINYFSDINSGFAAYAHDFAATLQFMDYGTFKETNALGLETGEFTAAEYALSIGWAKKLSDRFDIGANIKPIYSAFERYTSYGLAADVAGSFKSKDGLFSSSLIVENIGRQLTTYTSSGPEPLAFDVKFAMSKKFEHAPLRFHILVDNLHQWDVTYDDPNPQPELDPLTGELIVENEFLANLDNAARHMILGAEFVPGKGNFAIRFGYNYKRRQEMKIASRKAMVGFSFGFGFKVSKFHISYGRATYSLAGATNHFTISTRFSDFLK
jgi:hypothetical protein